MKSKNFVLFLGVMCIFAASVALLAQEEHWSKYKYPTEFPPDAKIHYIEKGDTLWDLAERYLGNPFLWPKIWELNKYITDPDLIFPQDPLIISEVEVVAEEVEEVPEEEIPEEEVAEVEEEAKEEEVEPAPPPLIPVAAESDLYCSPLAMKNKNNLRVEIIGAEEEKALGLMENDIVYINNGSNQGVQPGDAFRVIHERDSIKHPTNGSTLIIFNQVGTVKVLVSQPNTSTAQITGECDFVFKGDYLIPYEEEPIPMVEEMPELDELSPLSGSMTGTIIYAKDRQFRLGQYSIVLIDLGTIQQIKPGDFLRIFERNKSGSGMLDQVVGQLVVIKTWDDCSLCRVTYSLKDFSVGALIEVK